MFCMYMDLGRRFRNLCQYTKLENSTLAALFCFEYAVYKSLKVVRIFRSRLLFYFM